MKLCGDATQRGASGDATANKLLAGKSQSVMPQIQAACAPRQILDCAGLPKAFSICSSPHRSLKLASLDKNSTVVR